MPWELEGIACVCDFRESLVLERGNYRIRGGRSFDAVDSHIRREHFDRSFEDHNAVLCKKKDTSSDNRVVSRSVLASLHLSKGFLSLQAYLKEGCYFDRETSD